MSKRRAHYCVRIAKDICQHIAMGKTLNQALAEVGVLAPTKVTLYRWLEEYPEFEKMYQRALQWQANSHADRIVELADVALSNSKLAPAVKVASDIFRWSAEMRDPGKYSPKAPQNHKPPPKTPDEIKREIARLEKELGTGSVQPGMVTATPGKNEDAPPAKPDLKVVGDKK